MSLLGLVAPEPADDAAFVALVEEEQRELAAAGVLALLADERKWL